MADIIKAIKDAPNSTWSEPGVSDKDISLVEKSFNISFAPEFKKYLKSFESVDIGGVVQFVSLAPGTHRSEHAGVVNKNILNGLSGPDTTKGERNIRGKYCIGFTYHSSYLMQDKSGAIYDFNGSTGDIAKISTSMANFITDNYDKASKYVKPKSPSFESPKEKKSDNFTGLVNGLLFPKKG